MVQDDSEENEREQQSKIVESHVAHLAEHFDSVLVIVTKRETVCTRAIHRQGGNYYASYGAAKEWITAEEERTRETQRG